MWLDLGDAKSPPIYHLWANTSTGNDNTSNKIWEINYT